MHELSVTQSIVEQIVEVTGEAQVTGVRLEVGELSGVVAGSVRFCFELIADGTTLQGAALRIDETPGRAHCSSCAAEFALHNLILLCPCGSAEVRVVDGDQLLIKSVEVA